MVAFNITLDFDIKILTIEENQTSEKNLKQTYILFSK